VPRELSCGLSMHNLVIDKFYNVCLLYTPKLGINGQVMNYVYMKYVGIIISYSQIFMGPLDRRNRTVGLALIPLHAYLYIWLAELSNNRV
jgi:hypothetical protein